MPEQLMCPMRSDAKAARSCEPDKCMWGRLAFEGFGAEKEMVWYCAVNYPSLNKNYPNGLIRNEGMETRDD